MADERHLPAQERFLNDVLLPHLAGGRTSQSSGLIRKLAVKARGRWWLARLGRGLRNDPDAELPEGIEEQLDDLMSGLGDRDTIVRYSSAKYLGRIAALLPPELSDQIVLATIGLFAGTEDEPVVETAFGTVVDPGGSTASGGAMGLGGSEATRGEARWHGVCLAVAELARRGLLDADAVAEVTPWVVKALTFDLRRASHSIGANVRDAASYVLWSLSRASPPDQLAAAAEKIATSLVCVAVFDREVGVRRASSAAFQEGVGRLGLYPAGIDVLAKTDFYSVSVRRKAFTVAAPAVAEHAVYRAAMREFLHNITLRHWDIAMRTAGAAALKAILALSSPDELSDSITRELAQVPSLDSCSAHGALAAMTQIASLTGDATKARLLASLDAVRPAALVSTDAADIITAGCELIAATLTPTVDLAPVPRFCEAATRRREAPVHEALADACRRLSEVRDATAQVTKSIDELKSARAAQRQASALCLGHFQYKSHAAAEAPLAALLGLLTPEAKSDVETKRNAVRSLADLSCQRGPDGTLLLRPEGITSVVQALVSALDDYTTDQRGDVGSWVRTAAVLALGQVIGGAATAAKPADLVSQEQFDAAISGIVKQALEKLQVVRDASTTTWAVLLEAKADEVWDWPGANVFAMAQGPSDPRHADQWFSAGLEVFRTRYRPAAVSGILQSAGGSVSSTERSCAALLKWLRDLLPADSALLDGVLGDIVSLLANNFSSNRIAVPALTTIGRLFDAGIATWPASASHEVVPVPALYSRALALAARGASQIKSIDRLTAAMRVVVASLVLPFDGVRAKAADALLPFLAHRFPRIRMLTSEALYTTLTTDGDIDEELEEVVLETEWTAPDGVDEAPRVVQLVREHLSR
ncbi:hypothetical protein Q8F55_000973 [Vanrija albida]|uniref:Tubulin-specific chaperone D n=1 Tax=Vanrija albida TaxID=181172 RepID=A0ABR3QES4_9TREE